ncbi:rhomboid family intramembrane serine protease [Terriglobus roseus]|nr:rhomboid family intramembrane serine protease [Terriglobus roseus]
MKRMPIGRGPVTLSLPAFRGAVRQLVLLLVGAFFGIALLNFISANFASTIVGLMILMPSAVLGHLRIWELVTYAFLNIGILNTAFSLLTLWFTGSMLEESRGSRWFTELFYTSVVGGALIATLLAGLPMLTGGHISFFGIRPGVALVAAGISSPLFGVLVAFALLFGDVEFLLFFVLRIKAKYMVILGALLYVATLLRERDSFAALLALSCGLAGFLYVKLAHRRGMSATAAERYYGLRNDYIRWKRRRAARKFEVYMRKQDRIVKFDDEGRYIAPEDEVRKPNDRKWMN